MKPLRILHCCCLVFAAASGASVLVLPQAEWTPFLILCALACALPLLGREIVNEAALRKLRLKHRLLEKGALTDTLPVQRDDLASLAEELSHLQNELRGARGLITKLSLLLLSFALLGIGTQIFLPPQMQSSSAPDARLDSLKRGNQNSIPPTVTVVRDSKVQPLEEPTETVAPTKKPEELVPTEAAIQSPPPTSPPPELASPTATAAARTPTARPRIRPTRRPTSLPTAQPPASPTEAVVAGPFVSSLR